MGTKQILAALTVSALAACGGGGGGGGSDQSGSTMPSVTVANVSKSEGTGGTNSLDFTVTLSAAAAADVTVEYATTNDTAVGGNACDNASAAVDYVGASGKLTIPAGKTTGTVTIEICPDGELEAGDEIFTLNLANVSSNATLATAKATATILNDDAMALNDTGNTGWYDDVGVIDPLTGDLSAFPRQDGYLGRDVANSSIGWADGFLGFSFTKLGAAGKPLAVQDQAFDNAAGSEALGTQWSCLLDNVTGLVWETKTAGNTDNIYYLSGTTGTDRADNYVAAVNSAKLCGYSDWRIPSRLELQSIIAHTNTGGAAYLDVNFFPNIGTNVYWSSTSNVGASGQVWSVSFGSYGQDSSDPDTATARLLLVRGGADVPKSRFAVNSDGTVSDNWTGLTWKRCAEGYEIFDPATPADTTDDSCVRASGSPPVTFNWKSALAGSATLDFAGHKDWRVPNIKELQSLVDSSRSSPSIDTAAFPSTPAGVFWTSTTTPVLADYSEVVIFNSGSTSISGKSNNGYVRLVR